MKGSVGQLARDASSAIAKQRSGCAGPGYRDSSFAQAWRRSWLALALLGEPGSTVRVVFGAWSKRLPGVTEVHIPSLARFGRVKKTPVDGPVTGLRSAEMFGDVA